jgi:pyruvate,water dikinase
LEERGFVAEIKGDAAGARLEAPSQEEALTRLRNLGYLLMHLRQLDMAMGDLALAGHYADKLRRDLEQMEGAHQVASTD